VVAWTHLLGGFLLLINAINAGSLDPAGLVVMALLCCSGIALLLRQPDSWWIALLAQPPLLAYGVWLALSMCHSLMTRHPQTPEQYVVVDTGVLVCELLLTLSPLTALLYLLRPRTRESFGRPPASR
jgi:hypothetical protein